jgi:uncharacterized protein YndB with AHSA1/START domain
MGKTLHVQRSAVIPAPPERIFALLDDFRQWEHWSPWEELDPNMTHTYSGPERGVGAVHEWKGNKKAGEGRMEIVDADPPHRLDMDVKFIRPFKSENTTRLTLAENGPGSTNVTWSMDSPMPFMMRIADIFMNMDKRIGGDFEKGLAKLSSLAAE